MLLNSLTPDDQRAVYAGAFLLYAREVADWSPSYDEPGCRCARCAPVEPKPHRGTEAWRVAMHRRHRAHQRSKR